MKIVVLTVDGLSASLREEDDRIHSITKEIAKEKKDITFINLSSVGLKASSEILDIIKNLDGRLLLLGKSMGGAKSYDLVNNEWDHFKKFDKFAFMTIDAHGQILLDGKIKPFGKKQDLEWNNSWEKDTDKFRTYNVYQHKKWPYGASFPKAFLNIKITGKEIDHFNIVNNEVSKKMIKDAIDFICKE